MALELNGTTGVSLVQDGVVTAADLASGAITASALPAGSVLQVVQDISTTTVSASTTAYVDTGLEATITPISISSKILVFVSHNGLYKDTTSTGVNSKIVRDGSTAIDFHVAASWTGDTAQSITSASMVYLDSPASTSAITYKTQISNYNGSGSASLNSNGGDRSSITLMEISG